MAGKKRRLQLQLQLQSRTHKGAAQTLQSSRAAHWPFAQKNRRTTHALDAHRRTEFQTGLAVEKTGPLLLPARGACALGTGKTCMLLSSLARLLARSPWPGLCSSAYTRWPRSTHSNRQSKQRYRSGRDGRGADAECAVRPRRSMTSLAAVAASSGINLRRCHLHARRLSRRSRGEA